MHLEWGSFLHDWWIAFT